MKRGEREGERKKASPNFRACVRVYVCTLGCERKRRGCVCGWWWCGWGEKKGGIFLVCLVCLRSLSSSSVDRAAKSASGEREKDNTRAPFPEGLIWDLTTFGQLFLNAGPLILLLHGRYFIFLTLAPVKSTRALWGLKKGISFRFQTSLNFLYSFSISLLVLLFNDFLFFSLSWWATNSYCSWTQYSGHTAAGWWWTAERERQSFGTTHTLHTHEAGGGEATLFPTRREMHSCRLLLRHFLGRESAAYAICFYCT